MPRAGAGELGRRVARDNAAATEAVSVAKAWVSDAISGACARGHQVHGAIGFTAERDLQLFSSRARAAELDFGDAAWLRQRLGARFGV